MSEEKKCTWAGPVVLELMGHRRLVGWASEDSVCGKPFLRMKLPQAQGKTFDRLFSPEAIYAITPTTDEVVRELAQAQGDAAPVSAWEFRDVRALPAHATQAAREESGGECIGADAEDAEMPEF